MRPGTKESRALSQRALGDVASWLRYKSTSDYCMEMPLLREKIFERTKSPQVTKEGNMMTKGIKTSEFWLSLASTVAGIALGSGVLVDGGTVFRVVSIASSMLSAFGYTWARTKLKSK